MTVDEENESPVKTDDGERIEVDDDAEGKPKPPSDEDQAERIAEFLDADSFMKYVK
jgi:hypothetical protein